MPCHDRGPLFPDCLDPNAAMTTPTPDALTLALQPLLVPAFTLWEAPFTWLEMVAFVLSLAMVAANMRVMPVRTRSWSSTTSTLIKRHPGLRQLPSLADLVEKLAWTNPSLAHNRHIASVK